MAISMNSVAYGAVAVGAAVLLLGGAAADRMAADARTEAGRSGGVPAYSAALAKRLADAVGPSAPAASVDVAGIRLRSVGFTMPTEGSYAFPPGPGLEAMTTNCVSCHTPGQITMQPRLTRAEWVGEVTKMVNVYKAPVDPADVPAIVAFLSAMPVPP